MRNITRSVLCVSRGPLVSPRAIDENGGRAVVGSVVVCFLC